MLRVFLSFSFFAQESVSCGAFALSVKNLFFNSSSSLVFCLFFAPRSVVRRLRFFVLLLASGPRLSLLVLLKRRKLESATARDQLQT